MKKRLISLLLTVAMTSAMVTGCGSKEGGAADKDTASASQTETGNRDASAEDETEKTDGAQKVTFTCWYDEDNMESM